MPLIVRTRVLPNTSASPSPLQLVTADGTPMLGGTTGCAVTLKIPVAVPHGHKLRTSALVFRDQWAYEANISGVDMIIGNPFLYSMRLVPIPSRRVLMREGDVIALQSVRRNCVSPPSNTGVTVSTPIHTTSHGRSPEPTPTDGPELDEFNTPVGYIHSDSEKVQPWQPPAVPVTPFTVSLVDMVHDDVLVGVNGIKSVPGGFREKRSRKLRADGLLPPLAARKGAMNKNVEGKIQRAWKKETNIVLNQVRDDICAFAGFQPQVDAFAEKANARFPLYWDRRANAFRQDWSRHKLWINPPYSRLPEVVDKLFEEEASGIIVVPVWPSHEWFHKLSLIAVTWWDLPPGKPVFMTRGGGSHCLRGHHGESGQWCLTP